MKNIFKYALVFTGGILAKKLSDKIARQSYFNDNDYIDAFVYETKSQAENTISKLNSIIKIYGYADMSDVWKCYGTRTTNSGWSSTDNFYITETENGYILLIPPFEKIKIEK
jgi:hypothetical protein